MMLSACVIPDEVGHLCKYLNQNVNMISVSFLCSTPTLRVCVLGEFFLSADRASEKNWWSCLKADICHTMVAFADHTLSKKLQQK